MSRTTALRILYYVIALLDRSDLPKIGRDLPSATPKNAEDRSDLEFEGIQLPQVCHLLPVLKTEAEPGLAAAYEVACRRRVCLRARANVRCLVTSSAGGSGVKVAWAARSRRRAANSAMASTLVGGGKVRPLSIVGGKPTLPLLCKKGGLNCVDRTRSSAPIAQRKNCICKKRRRSDAIFRRLEDRAREPSPQA